MSLFLLLFLRWCWPAAGGLNEPKGHDDEIRAQSLLIVSSISHFYFFLYFWYIRRPSAQFIIPSRVCFSAVYPLAHKFFPQSQTNTKYIPKKKKKKKIDNNKRRCGSIGYQNDDIHTHTQTWRVLKKACSSSHNSIINK